MDRYEISHLDENDQLWRVVLKDNSTTVAFISNITSIATYVDPSLSEDKELDEVIIEKQKEIGSRISITTIQGVPTVCFQTKEGKLSVEIEKGSVMGNLQDAIYVGIFPTGIDDTYFDLVSASVLQPGHPANKTDSSVLRLQLFSSPSCENATYADLIKHQAFIEAIESESC